MPSLPVDHVLIVSSLTSKGRDVPMKHFVTRMSLFGLLTLALLGLTLGSTRAWAQARGSSSKTGQARLVPPVDWLPSQDEVRTFEAMKKGDLPATGSDARKVLDHAAQWYAYRFTQQEHQDSTSKGMQTLRKEAGDQILNPHDKQRRLSPQQVTFAGEFGRVYTDRLREVLNNPKLIARMNAAMMLQQLAATGLEQSTDALVEILRKPEENDAVKLWALRGLGDFFALGSNDLPDAFHDKEREARCIQALLDYLTEKSKGPADLPPDEAAALSYVRNEALIALGRTRLPAFEKLVGMKYVLERPTALVLLRFLARDGVTPLPSMKEQVSAAVALCQLRASWCKEYQADYPAYFVGRFLVEFLQHYNTDREQKREPWKLYAMKLSQALNGWKTELEGPPSNSAFSYVGALVGQADALLVDILEGKLTPAPTDLNNWLARNPPKNNSVYKGDAAAVVRGTEQATP
jgi:hypothetical protein